MLNISDKAASNLAVQSATHYKPYSIVTAWLIPIQAATGLPQLE